LGKFSGRLNYVCHREITTLYKYARDLAMNWVRDINLARHAKIPLTQCLNDPPALIEDLHEASVVWHRTDNKILLLIKPDAVRVPCQARDDRDPQASRWFQLRGIYFNGCADPVV
jgi:hypothetical protein